MTLILQQVYSDQTSFFLYSRQQNVSRMLKSSAFNSQSSPTP